MTDVGFLKWEDPLSWTETSPARFEAAIKRENRLSKAAVEFSCEESEHQLIKAKYILNSIENSKDILWEIPFGPNPKILARPNFEGGGGYTWAWVGKDNWQLAANLDYSSLEGLVAYTKDVRAGRQEYRLYVAGPRGLLWTHNKLGGSDVAVVGHRVYFVEQESPLRYSKLVSLDLRTGKDKRQHYHERDRAFSLEMVRAEGHCLFLLGSGNGIQRLHRVWDTGEVKPLSPEGVAFHPIGGADGAYLVRRGDLAAPWEFVGRLGWRLGRTLVNEGIEFCSGRWGILVTKNYGIRSVWKLARGEPPKKTFEFLGELAPHPWLAWGGGATQGSSFPIGMSLPGASITLADIYTTGRVVIHPPAAVYGKREVGYSISSDGIPVRWVLVRPASRPVPRGLVLVAYGAYGLPSQMSTNRWRPWIEAGWAVATLFVRGGGDGNEIWAALGRKGGKLQAVDDVEACCVELQHLLGLGPKQTVLFGRSAGGLLVGNIIARHPRGSLVGIAYAEVPYVDLLKTAANPALPLTEYEYEEFGSPAAGIAEFRTTLAVSPIHQLGPEGAPGVKVICRTGVNDMQVLPYESLKWILTLRGSRKAPDGKLLFVAEGGHFSYGDQQATERAEDFCLIQSFLTNT